jgi:hypothetical protein
VLFAGSEEEIQSDQVRRSCEDSLITFILVIVYILKVQLGYFMFVKSKQYKSLNGMWCLSPPKMYILSPSTAPECPSLAVGRFPLITPDLDSARVFVIPLICIMFFLFFIAMKYWSNDGSLFLIKNVSLILTLVGVFNDFLSSSPPAFT